MLNFQVNGIFPSCVSASDFLTQSRCELGMFDVRVRSVAPVVSFFM